MNIGAFFASLGAALLSRLSSVGAAVAAGFTTIIMSFTADERLILIDVKQTFHDEYQARIVKGSSEIDAIEGAATAAWNKFCHNEELEMVKEADATITLLASAAKSAAGLK